MNINIINIIQEDRDACVNEESDVCTLRKEKETSVKDKRDVCKRE